MTPAAKVVERRGEVVGDEIGVAFIRAQLGGPASQPVGDRLAGGRAEPFSFGLE